MYEISSCPFATFNVLLLSLLCRVCVMLTGVELALLLTDTIELCEGHERLRERLEFPYSKHQLRSASVCP